MEVARVVICATPTSALTSAISSYSPPDRLTIPDADRNGITIPLCTASRTDRPDVPHSTGSGSGSSIQSPFGRQTHPSLVQLFGERTSHIFFQCDLNGPMSVHRMGLHPIRRSRDSVCTRDASRIPSRHQERRIRRR